MFMGGDDLRDWARGAEAGTSLCLGVGAALPDATARQVSALVQAGVIDAPRRKIGPERYSFIVQRRTARYIDCVAAKPRQRGGRRGVRAGTAERRILKILLHAAAHGLPCPTNAALARAAGLSGELAASYRLKCLVQRGMIRVAVPNDPRLHRVVTIVASGKATKAGAR